MHEFTQCPWRDQQADDTHVCRLATAAAGYDHPAFVVHEKVCKFCVTRREPTLTEPNDMVASLLYSAALDRQDERLKSFASGFLQVIHAAPPAPPKHPIPCEHLGRILVRGERLNCRRCDRRLCTKGVNGVNGVRQDTECETCELYEEDWDRATAEQSETEDGQASAAVAVPQSSSQPAKAFRWAVGITTAPRATPTLQRSLESLAAAGWDLAGCCTVFAEPESAEVNGIPSVQRLERAGAWGNWFQGFKQLVEQNPDADAYFMLQDDVLYCRGLREYLEATLWPEDLDRIAWVSLYCSAKHAAPEGPVIHQWPAGKFLWGALAYVFPPAAARSLLLHERIHAYTQNKIDLRISYWAKWAGRQGWYFRPSLVQHIRGPSTLAHGQGDYAFADTFVGEDYDVAKARLSTKKKRAPLVTDFGESDYTLPREAWEIIAQRLKPGLRTLEFGSGLTTLLFEKAGCEHMAIEDDPRYVPAGANSVYYVPAGGSDPPRYSWLPDGPFDVLLIDGPADPKARLAHARDIPRLTAPGALLVVDDTHRPDEQQLVAQLLGMLPGAKAMRHELPWKDTRRAFTVIEVPA